MSSVTQSPAAPAKTFAGNVELVAGHRYRDRIGRIHTLTVADMGHKIRAWIALAQAGGLGLELPKQPPVIFASAQTEFFFADFLKGTCFVGQVGEGDPETLALDLVEDVTETNVTETTTEPVVSSGPHATATTLGTLKPGQKFTHPMVITEGLPRSEWPIFTRTSVEDIYERGSVTEDATGMKFHGNPEDKVILVVA